MLTLATIALLLSAAAPQDPPAAVAAPPLAPPWVGRWQGRIELQGAGSVPVEWVLAELDLENSPSDVLGHLRADLQRWPVAGSVAKDGSLNCTVYSQALRGALTLAMAPDGRGMTGTLAGVPGLPARLDVAATRASSPPTAAERALPLGAFAIPRERQHPLTVDAQQISVETAAAIDARVAELREQADFVGLTLAVAESGGEVTDLRSYGYADLPERRVADGATRYRWASISKPLVSVIAMQLAAAGTLDLDGDVRDLVPEFSAKNHVVTVRHILCHQSGITHYSGAQRTAHDSDRDHPFVDPVVALTMFEATPLRFEPGTDYSYSTHAFTLLAAVLERASGKALPELIATQIAAPAGLRDLAPDRVWDTVPHRTRGYYKSGRELVQSLPDDISWKLAGGGLISSAGDLARFGIAAVDGRLLDNDTFATWTSPQATSPTDGSAGRTTRSGLGIRVGSLDGEPYLTHTGSQNETATVLVVDPARQLAVAIMCNTVGTKLNELGTEVLRLLRKAR